jgi:hypothetical protein
MRPVTTATWFIQRPLLTVTRMSAVVSKNPVGMVGAARLEWSLQRCEPSCILTLMDPVARQLQFLLMMFAGWLNRQQLELIEYILEENRLLKERLGSRRIQFTDAERRRLARKAHLVGRTCSVGSIRWSRRILYCASTAIWSYESGTTASGAAPVARVRCKRSSS